jgi:HlyD family secretion protein
MMKNIQFPYFALVMLCLLACNREDNDFDASGSFEAVETIISAEANGKILQFDVREGQELNTGQVIGYIDSTSLHLQKLQLEQNKKAILSGKPQTQVQIRALKQQLATAKSDRNRIANLVEGGVANQKQLDDANAQIATLEAQISAQESTLNTTTSSIEEQGSVVGIQLREVKDQLEKCKITNPVNGTVLSKYAEPYEMTSAGRPLYKIADLSSMTLRAYITGDQLPIVKLDQEVKVLTDDGQRGYKEATGTVTWVSDKAEFTPKTIHTKNERANLVYAIKVRVPNDGTYKIGMYGEIRFL